MDDVTSLFALFVVLVAATHIVSSPDRYVRAKPRDAFAALLSVTGHDRSVAERLVVAEIERGASSRSQAAQVALARLLRDRAR